MDARREALRGIEACGRAFTGWLGAHPLFLEMHRRPSLLIRELAWRWAAGGFLLALGSFAVWRVWSASLPALRTAGVLALTPDSLLAGPGEALEALEAGVGVLLPPVTRAFLGLLPLGVFIWVCAFSFGRTAVLARFDPQLPRRPWMLAQAEALRILAMAAVAAAWAGALRMLYLAAFSGGIGRALLALAAVAAATIGAVWLNQRLRRVVSIGLGLALAQAAPLLPSCRRAWRMDTHIRIVPVRKAIGRLRTRLLLASVVVAFVPAPFHFGWALGLWTVLFSLPWLAATDAWRLGAQFALLRGFGAEGTDVH